MQRQLFKRVLVPVVFQFSLALLAAAPVGTVGTNTITSISTEEGLGRIFYFLRPGESKSPTTSSEMTSRDRIELAIHPPVTKAAFGGTTMVPLEKYTITVFSAGKAESLIKLEGLELEIQRFVRSLEKYMELHVASEENSLTNVLKLFAEGPGSNISLLFERNTRGQSVLLVSQSAGPYPNHYRLAHSQVLLIRHALPTRGDLLAKAKEKARELTAHNERVKSVLK